MRQGVSCDPVEYGRSAAWLVVLLGTIGLAVSGFAWTEHVIYTPALGSLENALSVALAPSSPAPSLARTSSPVALLNHQDFYT